MNQVNQKILFVTGKGGVGKSTVAAALALKASRQGKRVLLVELADHSYYCHLLGIDVQYAPTPWKENLWVSCWEGDACLREYLKYYVRIEAIVALFFNNVVMKTFIQAAPALREISVLGKATSGIRDVGPTFEYDLIVIDAYATGHFRALLRAPKGLAEAVRLGPMGDQSRQIDEILRSPQYCSYVIVTLPEELPVSECRDLHRDLQKELGMDPKVFCNKVWEIPLSPEELSQLGEKLRDRDLSGLELTNYLQVVEERQAQALRDLKSIDNEFTSLPLSFGGTGEALVEKLAERINWDGLGI